MANLRPAVNDSDNFLTKIIKYIPAEVITVYTAALGVWSMKDPPPVSYYNWVLILIVIITPIWTYYAVVDNNVPPQPNKQKRAIFHAVVAFISFIVWLYALGDNLFQVFLTSHHVPYHQSVGSIIIILYSGLLVPLAERIVLGTQPPVRATTQARTTKKLTDSDARSQIVANLTDNGSNNFSSYISDNVYGIQRRCDLSFPASCWDDARNNGFTFADVLSKTTDKTLACIQWLVDFDGFDPDNHNEYINSIEFSGLWRPDDPYPPHKEGRALDITTIGFISGNSIVFNNVAGDVAEPPIAVTIRNNIFPGQVSQYLSPWWIRSIGAGGVTTDRANDRTSPLDKQHLNHLHLTIYPA